MKIVFICFRLISGSKELVYYISTAGWEVPLPRTSLLDHFPVLTVLKSPLWSASVESENTGWNRLPIFLIIMDDAPRALFLDERSRRKQGTLLSSMKYKIKACLFFSTDITCQGQVIIKISSRYKMRCRKLESISLRPTRAQGNYMVNWMAFKMTHKSAIVVSNRRMDVCFHFHGQISVCISLLVSSWACRMRHTVKTESKQGCWQGRPDHHLQAQASAKVWVSK